MDLNPYESPKCVGYQPPTRPVSQVRDFVALVGCALAVYVAIQVIAFGVGIAAGYIKLSN